MEIHVYLFSYFQLYTTTFCPFPIKSLFLTLLYKRSRSTKSKNSNNLGGTRIPMPHTQFQCIQPTDSGEEDFEGFLPNMGVAAMLVM